MNQLMTKAYVAPSAIDPYTIVKPGPTDDDVVTAAGPADFSIGVVENVAPAAGERVDVVMSGIAEVRLGAVVVRGALLTSNAAGKAVTAVAGNRVICVARASGVAGDVIEVLLSPGVM